MEEREKIDQFFEVVIRFHPGRLQQKITSSNLCTLVGELLTILNHYFNISFYINMFSFCYSKAQ